MLREELGWNQQKSDELLLPVIQRVNRRGAAAAANKQSDLDAYFGGLTGGVGGSGVPRKRQAYSSKRLQKVVSDYRSEQRKHTRTTEKGGDLDSDQSGEGTDVDGSDDYGKRKTATGMMTKQTTSKPVAPRKRSAANERKARKSSKVTISVAVSRSTKRKKWTNDSDGYDDDDDDDEYADADGVTSVPARPRPKPVRKKANTNPGLEPKIADHEGNG